MCFILAALGSFPFGILQVANVNLFFTLWSLSSVEQDHSGSQVDAGEEISGEFVVTGGGGAKC
jgi:hypothetical protein